MGSKSYGGRLMLIFVQETAWLKTFTNSGFVYLWIMTPCSYSPHSQNAWLLRMESSSLLLKVFNLETYALYMHLFRIIIVQLKTLFLFLEYFGSFRVHHEVSKSVVMFPTFILLKIFILFFFQFLEYF